MLCQHSFFNQIALCCKFYVLQFAFPRTEYGKQKHRVVAAYHFFLVFNSDNFLEDVNEPLWVQYDSVFEERLVIAEVTKVDDPSQVMIELQHCLQVFVYAKRSHNVFDLKFESAYHARFEIIPSKVQSTLI